MRRWISCAAVALLATSVARAEAPAFDVLSYDVRIAPDFETQTISGQTIIRFKSTADDLTVLSFSANTLDVTASLDGEHMVASEVKDDRRFFRLPHPLRKGETGRLTVIFLDTLRRELGEDAFWRGIKQYTRANWDKTVRAQDLQHALERSSNRDLKSLFRTWVYGPM